MSTLSLQIRLTLLLDSFKQTQQLINRLSKLPAIQSPGSLISEESGARAELSAEIHESLKEQEEDFELLRQEAEDQSGGSIWSAPARRRNSGRARERPDLSAQVTRLGEDLRIGRAQFRQAQLQAKRNADSAKRRERELLFAGVQEGNSGLGYGRRKGQEKISKDEQLFNASSDVTAALRRTHNLITAELERSQFARETLENSTKELSSLSVSYTNLDTLLSSSRSLASTLVHSQKSDTWYLESAFFILSATIAWLVFRRLIYGPGWWLAYFPLRVLWQLCLFVVQVLAGSLSLLAGAAGAKGQSSTLSRVPGQVSTTPAQVLTRTGTIPESHPSMPASSISVGAGDPCSKADKAEQNPQWHDKSVSNQVGDMAEQTRQVEQKSEEAEHQVTVLRERRADEPPNPKKRMWEEPVAQEVTARPRDEL